MNYKKPVLAAIASMLLMYGCIKKFELDKVMSPSYEPSLAIPLASSSLSVKDILNKYDSTRTLIKVDNDNSLYFIFKGRIFSYDASEIISIPNEEYTTNFNLDPTVLAALQFVDSTTVDIPVQFDLDFRNPINNQSYEVDTLLVNGGEISLNSSANFQLNSKIQLIGSTIRKDNQNVRLTHKSGTPKAELECTNTTIRLNSGGVPNRISSTARVTLYRNGTGTSANPQVTLSFGMQNLVFKRMYGYLGQNFITPDADTILIDIFNKAIAGSNNFTQIGDIEPTVNLIFNNSYGVPVGISMQNRFTAFYPQFGTSNADLSFQIPVGQLNVPESNPYLLDYPSLAEAGQTKTTTFTLNNSNTGGALGLMVDRLTKKIVYSVYSRTNPTGNLGTNFMDAESRLTLDAEVVVPMQFSMRGFGFSDTIAFAGQSVDFLDSIEFKLNMSNGLPLQFDLYLYALDADLKLLTDEPNGSPGQASIIGSSPTNPLGNVIRLIGAPVNANGRVINPTVYSSKISVERKMLNKLSRARYLLIAGYNIGTTNSGMIKIYDDYRLGVGISAIIKGKLN